ncbi:hypothetical protein Goklo_021864, partial [Gossypium klotzschianum]|nr:hypothetical protein [Gossypium klotzschianum]
VIIALAEILWEQLKLKRKVSSGSLPKVQQPFSSRSMDDLLVFLDGPEMDEKDSFICVVVNNIDGPGLRDTETQQYLARLASCSYIRVVASIDHVNAPLCKLGIEVDNILEFQLLISVFFLAGCALGVINSLLERNAEIISIVEHFMFSLWDKKMVHAQFNWYWYHVPTFAPYKVEGLFLPLILAHGSSKQSAKTALIVLQSLTPNAQSVFRILAEYQLSHPDDEGMAIDNLYSISRERFLVSSQVTLNAHLTEFKDHELVKTKRHSDGQDCLYIPLTKEGLEKLLSEIS